MKFTPEIEAALTGGAAVVISVSGGKDSDAMTYAVIEYLKAHGLTNEVHLVHADLGRAELKATPEHVATIARLTGLPLSVVRHSKFDLLDGIKHRMETRPEVPPWPSASTRNCTSDWKRGPISKWIRNQFPVGVVICCMGLRADESANREKKPIAKLRADCCAGKRGTKGPRVVWDWLPMHGFTTPEIWQTIGDRPHHEAYDWGNSRVSCALCVLADENDLTNGALQDPELFQAYCDIEIKSGFSFKQRLWLGTLAPQLLREDQRAFYANKK